MNGSHPSKRHYGIDLLRLVSMYMVVVLHVLYHGGVLDRVIAGTAKYNAAWLLESAAYCAVNCFAMISGYVGLKSRFKVSNLTVLWLQVTLYNVIFAVMNDGFSLWTVLRACAPVITGSYWYFTAYCGMFFLTPVIGAAVEHVEKRTLQIMLAGIFVLYSVIPTTVGEVVVLNGGYHALWLALLYMTGAYLRKYPPLEGWPKWKWLLAYLVSVLASWGMLVINNETSYSPELNLISYTSPTIVIAAASLLMLFSKMEIRGRAQKLVALFSAQAFGVYLIHDSTFIRETFISKQFGYIPRRGLWTLIPRVMFAALVIFVICILIDSVRRVIFDALRVKKGLDKVEERILRGKVR